MSIKVTYNEDGEVTVDGDASISARFQSIEGPEDVGALLAILDAAGVVYELDTGDDQGLAQDVAQHRAWAR